MAQPLNDDAKDQIFRTARTRNGWADIGVPEALIREMYDLAKMGPTSANNSPARFVFIHSDAGKQRLAPHVMGGNLEKVMAAPWVVIIAYDKEFYEKLPQLFPHNPDAKDWFSSPEAAFENGFRNGTLQGAYLMIAARMLGLDCGPMSGFDQAGVNTEFFEGDAKMGTWTANWLCNLGYGTDKDLFPRSPRLDFDEACVIL